MSTEGMNTEGTMKRNKHKRKGDSVSGTGRKAASVKQTNRQTNDTCLLQGCYAAASNNFVRKRPYEIVSSRWVTALKSAQFSSASKRKLEITQTEQTEETKLIHRS